LALAHGKMLFMVKESTQFSRGKSKENSQKKFFSRIFPKIFFQKMFKNYFPKIFFFKKKISKHFPKMSFFKKLGDQKNQQTVQSQLTKNIHIFQFSTLDFWSNEQKSFKVVRQ
jgi:hypothetical protein